MSKVLLQRTEKNTNGLKTSLQWDSAIDPRPKTQEPRPKNLQIKMIHGKRGRTEYQKLYKIYAFTLFDGGRKVSDEISYKTLLFLCWTLTNAISSRRSSSRSGSINIRRIWQSKSKEPKLSNRDPSSWNEPRNLNTYTHKYTRTRTLF